MMKRICKNVIVALVLGVLVGCQSSGPILIDQSENRNFGSGTSSSANNLGTIEGEWLFVYVNKPLLMFGKDFSPPPSLDSIHFRTNGMVQLVDSISRHDFVGTYSIDANKVKYTFTPPNATNAIELEFFFSWAEQGRALVLRPADSAPEIPTEVEWTYYRPERLIPVDSIVGTWTTTSQGKSVDMTFEKDGSFYMDGKKYWGYYRLWLSNHGNTLTTPIWIQGEGAFIINYLYDIDIDKLTLTPLGQDGPHKEAVSVWNKAASEEPPTRQ